MSLRTVGRASTFEHTELRTKLGELVRLIVTNAAIDHLFHGGVDHLKDVAVHRAISGLIIPDKEAPTDQSKKKSPADNTAMIVGIVVGAAGGLLILVVALVYVLRSKTQVNPAGVKSEKSSADNASAPKSNTSAPKSNTSGPYKRSASHSGEKPQNV